MAPANVVPVSPQGDAAPLGAGAPGPTLRYGGLGKGVLSRRVRAEQLALLCQQWIRLPVPILLLCVYIAYLSWDYVALPVVLGWAALTIGILMVRSVMIIALRRGPQLARDPELWARRFTGLAALSGIVSGSAALLFFDALPADRQALLTMVMCCWGAGALASSSTYPRAYAVFAVPFFAQIAVAWLQAEAEGSWFIALLLAAFLAVMLIFVRDMGRVAVQSIELRFANEELLAQKEELIGLMRAEFQRAEEARASAEQASRSKSQFLAAASHDLRQPLHALSLFTALLNDVTEDPKVREVGRSIDRSVQSLERLFNALLDLSKLDAGVVTPELRACDLCELLERLSLEYRPKAAEKHLQFSVQCGALWVRTDPILLERILRNLLENALRFTRVGAIRMEAERRGGDISLVVSDTGIGIPPSEQTRIFEEFYQLHNPGRERSEGLGLGLSIVRRLVDLLRYRIAVRSTPGNGTSFELELPNAALDGASIETPAAEAQDGGSALAGLRVLVLDDDIEVRAAMASMLENWGCEALVAASVDEAHRLAAATPPAVVLSDLRLAAGASGIDAISALRAEIGPVAAALITGDTAAEKLVEVRSTGLRVLHKPVQVRELRRLLVSLARVGPAG
jgi:two-component system, sensor histidine kinase